MTETALKIEDQLPGQPDLTSPDVVVENLIIHTRADSVSRISLTEVTGNVQDRVPRDKRAENNGVCAPVFIGRNELLQRLTSMLRQGQTVQISGSRGIGKSALLQALVRQDGLSGFADGVVSMSCAGRGPHDVLQSLYDSFYIPENRLGVIRRPSLREITAALFDIEALIVLDDVSFRQEELELLVGILANCAVVVSVNAMLHPRYRQVILKGLPKEHAVSLLEHGLGRSILEKERSAVDALLQSRDGNPQKILESAAVLRELRAPIQTSTIGVIRPAEDLEDLLHRESDPLGRRVLRLLAAVGGAEMSIRVVRDLTKEVSRDDASLNDTLTLLCQNGMVVKTDVGIRLMAGVRCEPADVKSEIGELLDYMVAHTEDDVHPQPVASFPGTIVEIAMRGIALGLDLEVLLLVRATEGHWVRLGQWDTWQRLLRYHLDTAIRLGNDAEIAWGTHELGLSHHCLGNHMLAVQMLNAVCAFAGPVRRRGDISICKQNLRILKRAHAGNRLRLVTALVGVLLVVGITAVIYGVGQIPRRWGATGGSQQADETVQTVVGDMSIAASSSVSRLVYRPGRLDFGEIAVGTAGRQIILIENPDADVVHFSGMELSQGEAAGFSLVRENCTGKHLGQGAKCSVEVDFHPKKSGLVAGRLYLRTNQPASAPIYLLGTGRTIASATQP